MPTEASDTSINIEGTSYPDFVGLVGQHNTPPGGHRTVHKWLDHGEFDAESYVLDLACSTGFSGREVHAESRARIFGIDISEPAIESARKYSSGRDGLTYQVANATALPVPNDTFTHVVAGCNFGFIQDRSTALNEVVRTLKPGGALCVSSFYYRDTPPESLLSRVESAIGFRPETDQTFDFWKDFFESRFDSVYEHRVDLHADSHRRVARQVRRSIRSSSAVRGMRRDDQRAVNQRLLGIREALNAHREYQGLSVAVWRLRAE